MKFPKELLIKVVDADSAEPIPQIALTLRLFARGKNDYNIALLTDSVGQVVVSPERVRKEIAQDKEIFPMDYSSSLEECFSMAEIETCGGEDLSGMGDAMRMFQDATAKSEKEIRAFEQAVNAQYIPAKQRFDIEKENAVMIRVLRRERLGS
jgi:hypothetical protein